MIDWACVRTLMNEIGEEDFDDVIPLFLQEMDATVAKLAASKDRGTLAETLHFLKGASLNLGFGIFSGMCVAGEAACKNGSSEQVDTDALADAYARSRQQFLDGLANGVPA
ncbi:Hpt domain-containing protein [Celeribacter sp.]|uniref:Hpt domain-containing protein n=1 Tax=Celeribacter sp. TaxID=1890673 RepID=UPI003A8F4482